jgi:hypothetical protein
VHTTYKQKNKPFDSRANAAITHALKHCAR